QASVRRAGALRVQGHREAFLQQNTLLVQSIQGGLTCATTNGDRADRFEEGATDRSAEPGALEIAGLRKEMHGARGRDRDRDRVEERQVIACEDHRSGEGDVVPAFHPRSVDETGKRADQATAEGVGETGPTRLRS